MKNPECPNCGGSEYVLESGFYFCSECNLQSQDIVEQVYEFYGGQTTTLTKKTVASPAKEELSKSQTVDSRKVLTSWEAVNYVLVGMVNELMLLGASKKFKKIVLKLWSAYLKKIEIAFISQSVEKKPRLGLYFRKKDAELVYGATKDISLAHRKPIYRAKKRKRTNTHRTDASVTSASSRSSKYRLTLKKKALAKAEYLKSSSFSSQSSILTMEALTEKSMSETSSQRSFRLRYSKHAKRSFVSLLENAKNLEDFERKDIQSKLMYKESVSIRHIKIMQVVAILRLALFLAGEDIHLADILRWNEEGYLSIENAEKLLPEDVVVQKDVKAVFGKLITSRNHIEMNVGRISNLLGLSDFKVNLRSTIMRYIIELSLPDEIMETLIDKLIFIKSVKLKISTNTNYEGRAMAMVVFALKLLFGLDGITERKISDLATAMNCKSKQDKILFNWTQWMKFINARSAVCSHYHATIREKYYPNSRFGGPEPFLSQWDNTPPRQIINRIDSIDHAMKDSLRRVIKGLMNDTVQPFPPSKTPFTLILQLILKNKNFKLAPNMRKFLETNFQKHSIDYLLSPDVTDYISQKLQVNIQTSLRNKFIFVEPRKFPRINIKPIKSLKAKKVKLYLYDGDSSSDDEMEQITNDGIGNHTLNDNDDTMYYFPKEYWIYKGNYELRHATIGQFETLAAELFPESFYWLLEVCSKIISQPIRDLYVELLTVQKLYFNVKFH